MTTSASHKMHHHGHNYDRPFLSPFNQWEVSISGEIGNLPFPEDVYSLSIYLDPHPYPVKSSILCWHPVFSRFCLPAQPSNEKCVKKAVLKWHDVNSTHRESLNLSYAFVYCACEFKLRDILLREF